jgi:hypothetical protein
MLKLPVMLESQLHHGNPGLYGKRVAPLNAPSQRAKARIPALTMI